MKNTVLNSQQPTAKQPTGNKSRSRKIRIILLLLSFVVMSCTENDFVKKLDRIEAEHYDAVTYKEISFSQLLAHQTIRQKLQLSDGVVQGVTASSSSSSSLFVPLGNTKYMMQTEGIVKLQKGNITSYTIALYDPSNPLSFVNLMLTPSTETEAVKMQIVTYDLSEEDQIGRASCRERVYRSQGTGTMKRKWIESNR